MDNATPQLGLEHIDGPGCHVVAFTGWGGFLSGALAGLPLAASELRSARPSGLVLP